MQRRDQRGHTGVDQEGQGAEQVRGAARGVAVRNAGCGSGVWPNQAPLATQTKSGIKRAGSPPTPLSSVIYDTHERRGRAHGAVPALLRSALPAQLVAAEAADQRTAIVAAWRLVRPGDRLVVIGDLVDEGLEQLQALTASVAEDGVCGSTDLREREVRM